MERQTVLSADARRGSAPLRSGFTVSSVSLHTFFDAPAPERRAAPSRADALLSFAAALVVLTECALRPALPHRASHVLAGLCFAAMLSVRVARPLLAALVAFTVATAHTVATRGQSSAESLYSPVFVLLIPYALARWGSRREVAIGAVAIAITFVIDAALRRGAPIGDAVGGALALALPLAIGASVRFRAEAEQRALAAATERARWREREELARELHDTVAHHIAAVTVQAQAAQAVMHKRPDAAMQALAAIEAESSRALTEMRRMVSTLRDAPLEGPARIEQLVELARRAAGRATIELQITGPTDALAESVHGAVYRIAQEAITNAIKHGDARRAITVVVRATEQKVELEARNDRARFEPRRSEHAGFGLIGMRERATLLGGTFSAGPTEDGQWLVRAMIPADAKEVR